MLTRILFSGSVLVCLFVLQGTAQLNLLDQAELVGIQVDEKAGTDSTANRTDVSFIFNGRPKAFFNNFDAKESVLTIDFYEAVLGDIPLPQLTQSPFTSSTVSKEKIDINRDIDGLEPNFKDIVKVRISVEKGLFLDFSTADDYNVTTLTMHWSKTANPAVALNNPKIMKWKWVAGGIAISGLIAALYIYHLSPPNPIDTLIPNWDPPPPTVPGYR